MEKVIEELLEVAKESCANEADWNYLQREFPSLVGGLTNHILQLMKNRRSSATGKLDAFLGEFSESLLEEDNRYTIDPLRKYNDISISELMSPYFGDNENIPLILRRSFDQHYEWKGMPDVNDKLNENTINWIKTEAHIFMNYVNEILREIIPTLFDAHFKILLLRELPVDVMNHVETIITEDSIKSKLGEREEILRTKEKNLQQMVDSLEKLVEMGRKC